MSWPDGDPLARDLAERWAPVWYQDVADGAFNDADLRRLDLLTAIDFDGNTDPYDNVENARSGDHPLRPVVYFDVVTTETHAFLLYSVFHPVDWSGAGTVDHENDMEHVWLVIERSPGGDDVLVLLVAQAHGEAIAWSNAPPAGLFDVLPGVELEDGHPRLFIEAHGHGPASCAHPGGLPYTEPIDCDPPASSDLVVYRVAPGADPATLPEPDVTEPRVVASSYALVAADEALWPLRSEVDTLWDEPFDAALARNADERAWDDVPIDPARLGADFRGDEGGGGGVPPWGYLVDDDFLGGSTWGSRGEWLIDPAHLFATMFRDEPCVGTDAFWNYLGNPYLGNLAIDPTEAPFSGIDAGHRCSGDDPAFAEPGDPLDTATDAIVATEPSCGCAARSSMLPWGALLALATAARRRSPR